MNNKGADQPAHLCSLISTFVVRYLDSIIPTLLYPKFLDSYLVSEAEQTNLSPTWSHTPEDKFSRDVDRIEPGHEKMCLMPYANNKGSDQPVHLCSLISAFVVRCLDSKISLDSIAEISRLWLTSVAAQAGLCLAWSETPKDTFCHVVALLYGCFGRFYKRRVL